MSLTIFDQIQLNAGERESILMNMVMATSIHIPQPLLEAVDRKARALKMSRNRLIVRALERELTAGSDWSPGFFEQLHEVDAETVTAVDELLPSVLEARRTPPRRGAATAVCISIQPTTRT